MSSTRSVTASRSLPVMVSASFTASTSCGFWMNSSIGFLLSLRSGGADVGTRLARRYRGDYLGQGVPCDLALTALLRGPLRLQGRRPASNGSTPPLREHAGVAR